MNDNNKSWVWVIVIALLFLGAIAGSGDDDTTSEPTPPKYPECEQIARDFETTPENCADAIDAAVAEANR